jgi:hypothetical protein
MAGIAAGTYDSGLSLLFPADTQKKMPCCDLVVGLSVLMQIVSMRRSALMARTDAVSQLDVDLSDREQCGAFLEIADHLGLRHASLGFPPILIAAWHLLPSFNAWNALQINRFRQLLKNLD